MLRRMALERTDVSEERSAYINMVTRIGELGTTLAVTSNRRTRRENLKSYEVRWDLHSLASRALSQVVPPKGKERTKQSAR
jgi:hypothetical protein